MLRRMWRRLVRFLHKLWRTPPQPSPKRRGSKNEGEIPTSPRTKGGQEGVETLSRSATDSDEAEAWFNRGKQQYEAGDFLGAVAAYDKELEINPDYHEAWNSRGIALGKLGQYEQALASLDKALDIKPDYHKAWNNRGCTLYNLGQYEQAITSFEKVLEIKPDDNAAWFNRGVALNNLGQDEQAIASFEKVLEIKPDHNAAWFIRGVVLNNLGQHKQAIESYDKALQINPDDQDAWNNRGCALEKFKQYEEAIASFDKALEIQPDYYQAWNNRGIVLCDHLQRYEEAIASFDKALEIQPDILDAWHNRGMAAGKSRNYLPQAAVILQVQFPKSLVVKPNPTLTQRGYEGQLLSLQEGLKHCPQPQSQGYLHQAIGNAHYQEGKEKRDYRQYCYKAIKSYEQALTTLTQDAFPEWHLEVLQNYIKPLSALGETAQAVALTKRGSDLLRRLLSEPNRSDFSKKQLTVKFINLQQLTVDLYVQLGQPVKALEEAEADKNACLTWLLYAWNDEISEPNWEKIKQLTTPSTAIIDWHISPASITTFILKHDCPTPILITQTNQPEISSQLQHLERFEAWVKDWSEQYINYRNKAKDKRNRSNHSWRLEMEKRLDILKNTLKISAIEQELKDITKLILIPHRDLHRFPIHALFNQELDFTITYLPSAEIGLNLQQRQPNLSNRLLSVEHPANQDFASLDFAQIESEAISQMFDNPKRIQSEKATKNQVGADLLDEYNIFHFAGHATYHFSNPKKSELVLANEDKLTLEEICQTNLTSYNLVSLSACETAITGNQTITTEYVGLVSGFLSRGVANVVSTLWTVESAASALVMIEFYRRRQSGKSEGVALKEATQWLKDLTVQQLKEWYETFLIKLPAHELRIMAFIETELYRFGRMELETKPYNHPYYWAAFIVTGNPS